MNISGFRQSKRHRSTPIREGVAWRCKYPVSGAPLQREVAKIRFDTTRLSHLNDVIVKPIGLIFISNGRAIIQIPIGCSTL